MWMNDIFLLFMLMAIGFAIYFYFFNRQVYNARMAVGVAIGSFFLFGFTPVSDTINYEADTPFEQVESYSQERSSHHMDRSSHHMNRHHEERRDRRQRHCHFGNHHFNFR